MINSIEYNYWTFNRIEEKISEFLYELGSDIFRKFLEWLYDDICNSRNKSIYRYKEKRERTINTAFGSVAYNRRYYSERIAGNKKRTVFLLDGKRWNTCRIEKKQLHRKPEKLLF